MVMDGALGFVEGGRHFFSRSLSLSFSFYFLSFLPHLRGVHVVKPLGVFVYFLSRYRFTVIHVCISSFRNLCMFVKLNTMNTVKQ